VVHKPHGDPTFEWPFYGYDKGRTRTLPLADPAALHPPYTQIWARRAGTLQEFPPVEGLRSLFLLKNNGRLSAISRRTGRILWKRRIGGLAAASPAYAGGMLYAVLLDRAPGVRAGRVVAVVARTGRVKWSRPLPSRSESSPLVDRGTVYFGSENGTVYALRARDGFVRWTHQAPGAVKAGIAMDAAHHLYSGTYGGHVQSLNAGNGSVRWDASVNGAFGLSDRNFYSTPAVAFDRVYLGNTDGFVYSFGVRNGSLAWRHQTGSYVYGSPAVSDVAGSPTVYVGSYDGNFYALNARSGTQRWVHHAEGRISGGSVIIGDLVFYSTLSKTTTALGTSTGRVVWHTPRGAFNPVVSDTRRLYLVGYSSMFALVPTRNLPKAAAKPKHRAKPKRKPRAKPRHRRKRPVYVICLKHRGRFCVHAIVRHHRGRTGRRIR
jgi:outer membrane protein assembly factor BamB